MSKPAELTPKQERFIQEYLIEPNATQAAIKAGYSAKNADKIGSQLLGKARVSAAIKAAQQRLADRLEVTAGKILAEYASVAFGDIGEVLDFDGDVPRLRSPRSIPKHARRAIAAVKVKRYTEGAGDDALEVEVTEFRLWPKVEALRDLAKHLGLLKESMDVSVRAKVQGFDLSKLSDDQLDQLAGIVRALGGVNGHARLADAGRG